MNPIDQIERQETSVVQQLQHKDQAALLDVIDELSLQGLSRYVDLPRIIVCGDQSSGKSSVLEAISHIRFPTKDTLCTTFATELVIRRTATSEPAVKIIPGPTRDGVVKARLAAFHGEYKDPNDIAGLIESAKATISACTGSSPNSFSEDTLQISICNPDWPPLTIVDLPGLIHNANDSQPDSDVDLVKNLVEGYMKEPRTIILAIVSAHNDVANQVVLKLAKRLDDTGSRTLGVVTKPDLLPPAGSDKLNSYVRLARNEAGNHRLRLGWHVVKNRSYEESEYSALQRDSAEKQFFSKAPWASHVSPDCLGIDTLRTRLSKLLHQQIVASLPDIIEEIKSSLQETNEGLERLGISRSTKAEKQAYITGIAQKFQALAQSASDGTWNSSRFFDNPRERRLRAVVQNLNDDFAEWMSRRGHRWLITNEFVPVLAPPTSNRYLNTSNFPPLVAEPTQIRRKDFLEEIAGIASAARGQELCGIFNHRTIGELFREQSNNWKILATHHVQTVGAVVRSFIEDAFETLSDASTFTALVCEYVEPRMEEKLSKAIAKLDEVLMPHTRFHPISYNTQLVQSMKQAKIERQKEKILSSFKGKSFDKGETLATISTAVLEAELVAALSPTPEELDDKFACEDVLDYMQAYYDIAMKTFIDNVATLVIESCLIDALPTVFPADGVPYIDEDKLDYLASESDDVRSRRYMLKQKLKCLKKGLEICNRNTPYVRRVPQTENVTPVLANTSNPSVEVSPVPPRFPVRPFKPSVDIPAQLDRLNIKNDLHQTQPGSPSQLHPRSTTSLTDTNGHTSRPGTPEITKSSTTPQPTGPGSVNSNNKPSAFGAFGSDSFDTSNRPSAFGSGSFNTNSKPSLFGTGPAFSSGTTSGITFNQKPAFKAEGFKGANPSIFPAAGTTHGNTSTSLFGQPSNGGSPSSWGNLSVDNAKHYNDLFSPGASKPSSNDLFGGLKSTSSNSLNGKSSSLNTPVSSGTCPGTHSFPFQHAREIEGAGASSQIWYYQSIGALKESIQSSYSFEELRLADYKAGYRCPGDDRFEGKGHKMGKQKRVVICPPPVSAYPQTIADDAITNNLDYVKPEAHD